VVAKSGCPCWSPGHASACIAASEEPAITRSLERALQAYVGPPSGWSAWRPPSGSWRAPRRGAPRLAPCPASYARPVGVPAHDPLGVLHDPHTPGGAWRIVLGESVRFRVISEAGWLPPRPLAQADAGGLGILLGPGASPEHRKQLAFRNAVIERSAFGAGEPVGHPGPNSH